MFKQCQRHGLWKKKQLNEIKPLSFWTQLLLSHLHNLATGYGWKPMRLILAMSATTGLFILMNAALWSCYGIVDSQNKTIGPSIWDATSYTLSVLTTFGLWTICPDHNYRNARCERSECGWRDFFCVYCVNFFALRRQVGGVRLHAVVNCFVWLRSSWRQG